MNHDEALHLLRDILSDHLGLSADEVVPDAHLRDDLALDSLDAVDLASRVQEHIGRPIGTEQLADVATVRELTDLMVDRTAAGSAP